MYRLAVGETRLPRGLTDAAEMDPPPSMFLYFFLSFPVFSPSLPSSLLSQTLVSISAAVGTPDFRSANKLVAFPAMQSVGDLQCISLCTQPAQPKERKEGIKGTEH